MSCAIEMTELTSFSGRREPSHDGAFGAQIATTPFGELREKKMLSELAVSAIAGGDVCVRIASGGSAQPLVGQR